MSTSSAFWALFFAVQLPILQARNTAFGLTKLAAAACMQCTAQRQQKAANTSLLASRNLLQTATLVFPRSIVCSRLSNNINILAKDFQAANGGGHGPPAPWIRHWTSVVAAESWFYCVTFRFQWHGNETETKSFHCASANRRSTVLFLSLCVCPFVWLHNDSITTEEKLMWRAKNMC